MNPFIHYLATDWAITRLHARHTLKLCRDYLHFKRRGFTHKAAVFNAINSL